MNKKSKLLTEVDVRGGVKVMKKILLITMTLLLAITLAACNRSNSLVGRWEMDSGEFSRGTWQEVIEFFSDGTIVHSEIEVFSDGTVEVEFEENGTWRADGNQLFIDFAGVSSVFNFNVSSNTLTMENEDGEEIILSRL